MLLFGDLGSPITAGKTAALQSIGQLTAHLPHWWTRKGRLQSQQVSKIPVTLDFPLP
ncbi:hypothetical protein [Rhizobium tumorigenes]|uniref:hypothetical protein n=1 Tax=Rhizobium tumorigenes TaxID=2041385 RepID=UPI00241DA4D3|nr:hypothetical protein [Rhizobium tumorigenes]WFS02672.1 hypothetical protein PR016_08760 [Rhizobium tumorigenes]